MTGTKCQAMVYARDSVTPYPCENRARYEGYCGFHAPEKKAQRKARRGPSRMEQRRAAEAKQGEERALTRAHLANVIEWAKGNRGKKDGNPWSVPEVRAALEHLAETGAAENWMDVNTRHIAEGALRS